VKLAQLNRRFGVSFAFSRDLAERQNGSARRDREGQRPEKALLRAQLVGQLKADGEVRVWANRLQIPHGMQTGSPQSSTLPAVHHGEKRPGVIDCAAYAQGLRVATVEIADISESSNTKTDLSGLASTSLTRSCCARFRKN
jgi:hypothetical protein